MTRARAAALDVPQCYQCGAVYMGLKESPTTCTQCGNAPFLDWRYFGGTAKTATVFHIQQRIYRTAR